MQRISRRSFLKLTGTAAVAASTMLLTGCSINRVTIFLVENGEDHGILDGLFLPSFVSLDQAIKLARPAYIASLLYSFPELGDSVNDIVVEADPSYPNNGRQVQDENGNWVMTLAVRTNLSTGSVKVRSEEGITAFVSVPVLDCWTTLPDSLIHTCVERFTLQNPSYTATLAKHGDNGQIVWDSEHNASAVIYVSTTKK